MSEGRDLPEETLTVGSSADERLLDTFYEGLYRDAFAHQLEPLSVWKQRLWGTEPARYRLTIKLAGRDLRDPKRAEVAGGIVYELYPGSRCGLITYLVVAREHRGNGLGRRLLADVVRELHDSEPNAYVFGEVTDPTMDDQDPVLRDSAWKRIELFQAWGARVVDTRYVQPSLGPGLERDRHLRLVYFPGDQPAPDRLEGGRIANFLDEFYSITEGASSDDPELLDIKRGLHGAIELRRLIRPAADA